MKKMTHKIGLTFLFLSFAGIASAFDSGLEISNLGGIKNVGDSDWYTDHKFTGWIQMPLDSTNTNTLAIEGSLYAAKPANETDLSCFADLGLLRFSLIPYTTPGVKVSVDAGRIPVADITGLILNQTVDGAEFHGSFNFGNIDFLAAYTGLLNAQKEGAMMTTQDFADSNTNKMYAFGSKRVVGKFALQLPQYLGKSDLVFQGIGQYDARRNFESDPDQVVDTVYGTAMLSGPVTDRLYYTLSGTFETGILTEYDKQYSENSALASLRFDLYPAAKHALFAQFIYTPAETSFFSTYLPVTFQSAGTLFSYGYGNLIRASAGWNFNPATNFNLDFGAKAFFYSETPDNADSQYRGTELSGGATYKATSDLKFRLDGTSYMQYQDDTFYELSLKAIFDL